MLIDDAKERAKLPVQSAKKNQKNTNPNPKVRKSGVVAKAVLASMVLEEGSIRAAQGGFKRYPRNI